jgi:hypothetical protein
MYEKNRWVWQLRFVSWNISKKSSNSRVHYLQFERSSDIFWSISTECLVKLIYIYIYIYIKFLFRATTFILRSWRFCFVWAKLFSSSIIALFKQIMIQAWPLERSTRVANSIGETDEKARVWAVRYMKQVSRFANSMSQLSQLSLDVWAVSNHNCCECSAQCLLGVAYRIVFFASPFGNSWQTDSLTWKTIRLLGTLAKTSLRFSSSSDMP